MSEISFSPRTPVPQLAQDSVRELEARYIGLCAIIASWNDAAVGRKVKGPGGAPDPPSCSVCNPPEALANKSHTARLR